MFYLIGFCIGLPLGYLGYTIYNINQEQKREEAEWRINSQVRQELLKEKLSKPRRIRDNFRDMAEIMCKYEKRKADEAEEAENHPNVKAYLQTLSKEDLEYRNKYAKLISDKPYKGEWLPIGSVFVFEKIDNQPFENDVYHISPEDNCFKLTKIHRTGVHTENKCHYILPDKTKRIPFFDLEFDNEWRKDFPITKVNETEEVILRGSLVDIKEYCKILHFWPVYILNQDGKYVHI